MALCFLWLPPNKGSSEEQGLVTLVAVVLKAAILASLRWAVFVLADYQGPPRGKDEYVGLYTTLRLSKLVGYMGPLAAPAPVLRFQLCWELLSRSPFLLSPSPFAIMFNPTDTCLSFRELLIKRDEKAFPSLPPFVSKSTK